jgi:sugar lactone lactonase YvrE
LGWGAAALVAAAIVGTDSPARAQLVAGTVLGRQIGDGRLATAASLDRPSGVAFASDGALLIADRLHVRIRRVDPVTGIITTLVGSVPGSRQDVPPDQGELKGPLRIRIDAATGDLLIPDFAAHTIRRVIQAINEIDRIGGAHDVVGATGDGGDAKLALFSSPADAFPDDAGGVLIADRDNNKVRRIDALGIIDTVAGNGSAGYSGDDVPGGAKLAQLDEPFCVLPIPTANGGGFYVCDTGNHVVRRVSADGTITTVAGTGAPGFTNGPAAAAQLNGPSNLAFDTDGTLLIVDGGNNAIRRLDLGTNVVSTVAGTGGNDFTADGAPAAESTLARPTAITVAPDGRIVFAEDASHRVRAIDGAGNLVTLAGDGIPRFGGDGGPALDAQLGATRSVTRDSAGRLVVADHGNARIRRLDLCTGLVETIAGNGDPAYGGDDGPALEAGLAASDALFDADGNLLIADAENNRIRIVDPSGKITTLAGTGTQGFSGDDGPPAAAQLNQPVGLELDAAGALYVADFLNGAIRRIADGTITTVAGTGVSGFNGDDILATAAQLNEPTDMDFDADGNLYIADFNNHRIRRVDAVTKIITTVAGTGVAGFNGDGLATLTQLNQPGDVKFDATGVLWLTDFSNHLIRRFTPGGSLETVAGDGLRGWVDGPAARFLFPLRLDVLAPDQILIADRENFVVRSLGTITPDCTKVADDCRGAGAATCVPGGGKLQRDCFAEFKLKTPLPGSIPAPRVVCTDGDPACDGDAVSGQCTFRVSVCLNNEDPRLPCTPGETTALTLKGKLARSAGGASIVTALQTLAAGTPTHKGRGLAFTAAFGARNQCTPFNELVVARGNKKKGKGKLGALISTYSTGNDKDKLKLICQRP